MSRNTKLQRLTGMAVPALLAANAMVLVLGLASITDDAPAKAETIFIKAADGSMTEVDPNTPEGWKAIADAEQRGEQVVNAQDQPVTPTTTAPTDDTLPAATDDDGTDLIDVGDTVDGVRSTVTSVVNQVRTTATSVVRQVQDATDDATDLLDDTTGGDEGDEVDEVVDEVIDTVEDTTDEVVDTIDEPVDEGVDTVVDTVDDAVDDAADDLGGTVGGLVP